MMVPANRAFSEFSLLARNWAQSIPDDPTVELLDVLVLDW